MRPKQKYIYYIPAASVTSAKNAPFVEKLLEMDYGVLFLVSPMDEPGLSNLNSYKEKKFINITKEDLDLGDTNTKKEREFKLELGSTCDWIKKTLGDKVASVKNFQLPYYFALCASHWEVWFVNQHGKVDEETQT